MEKTKQKNFSGPVGQPYVKGPSTNPPTEKDLEVIRQIVNNRDNNINQNNYLFSIVLIIIILMVIIIVTVLLKRQKTK